MSKYNIPDYQKPLPMVQLTPLIDILFFTLIFFMIVSVLSQMENEVDIKVPKTKVAAESAQNAGKIIINITQDGRYLVNQQEMNKDNLGNMLKKVAQLFPNQQVVIRADENAYHKYVVTALDACMGANILDVSFSTINEEKK